MSTEKNADTTMRKKYSASTRPAMVDALSGKSGVPFHISASASSIDTPVLGERLILRPARDERRVEGPVLSERLILRPARDERRVEGLRTACLAGSWCARRTGKIRSWCASRTGR